MALSLKLNEAVVVALTRTDPRTYQYPDKEPSLMYSVVLQDGSEEKMFLPQSCSETLRDIRPRDFFSICKRKSAQGGMYFEVRMVGQTLAQPRPQPPSKLESQLAASIDYAQAQRTATLSKAPSATPDQPAPQQAHSHEQLSSHPTVTGSGLAQLLADCGTAVIDGYIAIRDHAQARGLDLVDITNKGINLQDLISTLIIHVQKQQEMQLKHGNAGFGVHQGGGAQQWRQ